MLDRELAAIIQCPACGGRLRQTDTLHCLSCHRVYQIENDIPALYTPLDTHEDIERRFWDQQYAVESRKTRVILQFHERFLEPLRTLPAGSCILEVACGTRADTLNIAAAHHQLVFTDISTVALQTVRQHAAHADVHPAPLFVAANAERLPFADSTFHSVIMLASFHHAHNPAALLHEVYRVAKPGAVIIVGLEPASWPYSILYPLLRPVRRWIRKKHKRAVDSIADDTTKGFSARQLRKIFLAARLTIIRMYPEKYFLELYDSSLRLFGRLRGRPVTAHEHIQRQLAAVDSILARLPIVKNFPWHWTVIAEKPKEE